MEKAAPGADDAHATGKVADQDAEKTDHALGNSQCSHQRPCENEKGDGQQSVFGDASGDQVSCKLKAEADLPHRIHGR